MSYEENNTEKDKKWKKSMMLQDPQVQEEVLLLDGAIRASTIYLSLIELSNGYTRNVVYPTGHKVCFMVREDG